MMTLASDSSEDHLASMKLMDFVGKEVLSFREEKKPVSTMKELKKQITSPEGVHRGKRSKSFDESLSYKGTEQFDGDGDDLDKDVEENNGSD